MDERDLAAELDAANENLAALAERVSGLTERVEALELSTLPAHVAVLGADLTETTHDLAAVVALLGAQVGEPFRSQAAEIIAKRQTGG